MSWSKSASRFLVTAAACAVAALSTATLTAQAPRPATAAEAAPFLGEWTLTLQGPNGPGTFALSVNVEKDKVAGEISSDQMPKQAIGDVSLTNKTLNLGYSFTWEGNPVEAMVSLTPTEDGKMTAQIDFARGAYIMTGLATKKEKPKSGD